MENFELFPGVEASVYGGLHIKKLKALVIADLHLGFEGVMAEKGIFVPKVQFDEIIERLEKEKREKVLIILGDIKHEFSSTTIHEFLEVKRFFEWAREKFSKVYLVRGNHDNFIKPICKNYGVVFVDGLKKEEFLFVHGHKEVNLPKEGFLVFAHEHPAIELSSKTTKEKIKCFLYGKIKKLKVVVLPAYSTLMEGTDITIPKYELLSPIWKKVDVDSLKCLGIDEEAGFFPLPEVGKLKVF